MEGGRFFFFVLLGLAFFSSRVTADFKNGKFELGDVYKPQYEQGPYDVLQLPYGTWMFGMINQPSDLTTIFAVEHETCPNGQDCDGVKNQYVLKLSYKDEEREATLESITEVPKETYGTFVEEAMFSPAIVNEKTIWLACANILNGECITARLVAVSIATGEVVKSYTLPESVTNGFVTGDGNVVLLGAKDKVFVVKGDTLALESSLNCENVDDYTVEKIAQVAVNPALDNNFFTIGEYQKDGKQSWLLTSNTMAGDVVHHDEVTVDSSYEVAFLYYSEGTESVFLGLKSKEIGPQNNVTTKAPFLLRKFVADSTQLSQTGTLSFEMGEYAGFFWGPESKLYLFTIQGQLVSVDTLGTMHLNGLMTIFTEEHNGAKSNEDRSLIPYLVSGTFYAGGVGFLGSRLWGVLVKLNLAYFCPDGTKGCISPNSNELTDIELGMIVLGVLIILGVIAVVLVIFVKYRRNRGRFFGEGSTLLREADEDKNPFKGKETSWVEGST